MKKIIIFLLLIFCVSNIYTQPKKSYYQFEIDNGGALQQFYAVKNDKHLEDNFYYIIQDSLGLDEYCAPRLATIKNSFVSFEYIEKNYPLVYERFCFNPDTDDSDVSDSLAKKLKKCTYFYTGGALNYNEGCAIFFKIIEDNMYLSMCMYSLGGLRWMYTKDMMEYLETALKEYSEYMNEN